MTYQAFLLLPISFFVRCSLSAHMGTFSTSETSAVPARWSLNSYQPSSQAESLLWISMYPEGRGATWRKPVPKGKAGK